MSVKQPRTRKFMAHEPGITIIDAVSGVVRRRELGCVTGDQGRGRVLSGPLRAIVIRRRSG